MDFTKFDEGTDILEQEAKLRKSLTEDAKTGKMFNVDPKVMKRVKDYMYFYGSDWDGIDPFTVVASDSKCKIARAFRKVREIILDLSAVGRLDLLDPIVSALSNDGIEIDFSTKCGGSKDLNGIINSMCATQKSISSLEDERNEIAQEVEDSAVCTKGCYNFTIKQMLRARKNEEKASQAVSKVGEKYADNNRDNTVFDAFIRDNCSEEE